MLRLLIVGVLALGLAGCTTTSGGGLGSLLGPQVSAVIEGVKQACSFLPNAQDIEKLIRKKDTGLFTNNDYVNAVCTAVTTLPLADGPGRRVPKVKGVVIRGTRFR